MAAKKNSDPTWPPIGSRALLPVDSEGKPVRSSEDAVEIEEVTEVNISGKKVIIEGKNKSGKKHKHELPQRKLKHVLIFKEEDKKEKDENEEDEKYEKFWHRREQKKSKECFISKSEAIIRFNKYTRLRMFVLTSVKDN